MIGCDSCQRWFHAACLGIDLEQINEEAPWYCDTCSADRGLPSNVQTLPKRNLRVEREQAIAKLQRKQAKKAAVAAAKAKLPRPDFSRLLEDSDSESDSDSDDDATKPVKPRSSPPPAKGSPVSMPNKVSQPAQSASKGSPVKRPSPNTIKRQSSLDGDAIRVKVRTQLIAILGEQVGFALEDMMYRVIDGNSIGSGYKAQFRDLIANLRDVNNPQLKQRVLSGALPLDTLVRMNATELASSELAQSRQAQREIAIRESIIEDVVTAAQLAKQNALLEKKNGSGSLLTDDATLLGSTAVSVTAHHQRSPTEPSVSPNRHVSASPTGAEPEEDILLPTLEAYDSEVEDTEKNGGLFKDNTSKSKPPSVHSVVDDVDVLSERFDWFTTNRVAWCIAR